MPRRTPPRHIFAIALSVALAAALSAQTPAVVGTQIERLNQTIQNTAPIVTPQLATLLSERATLLAQLIAADPARALQYALPTDLADRLRRIAPNTVELRGEFEGRTEDIIADDFEHQRSQTRHYLRMATGPIEAFFTTQAPHPGQLVRMRGLRLADRMAVEAVTPVDHQTVIANGVAPSPCTPLGNQKIAVIMLTMPSNLTFPDGYTSASLQEGFFGSPSDTNNALSLNGFWKEASYGQTSATGQVFGPFALAHDYDYSTQSGLATEAISLADSTVDFTQFTHIAFVFPIADWGGFGGDDSIGCNTISSPTKGNLQLSEGWFPAFPGSSPYIGIFNHELGHSLGLNHSSSDDYGAVPLGPIGTSGTLIEYGDNFATMGNNQGQYAAAHKSILHWLNPGTDYLEVTSAGNFSLSPYESTANPRAIRVLRDPNTSAWLWIEYRQPLGDVDKNIQQSGGNVFSGALVRYEDPALDSLHTYLLDFNPESTPNNFQTAALLPGTTWSDPSSLLTLTANSASTAGLNISVSYDTACASLQYSAASFPATGGSGSVTVTAPGTCNWTASSNASWLTFTSPTSGNGNGTVGFSVAANANATQQTATLTVQRQSTRIIELGTVKSVLSVSPVLGTGDSGQFTFQFDEASGYQNISSVDIYFGRYDECHMQISPSGKYLWLTDTTGAFLGPIYFTTPNSSLSNTLCSVNTTGSSISGSATGLTITLQMSFTAAFAGSHRISATVSDSTSSSNQLALGTWMVPITQQPGVTITSNVVGAPFTLDGGSVYTAPATFYWAAGTQHTIAWLNSTANQPGARYVFQNWTDGGTNPRTITVPDTSTTYTATIEAQYLLTLAASPANAGGATVSPISPDSYYNAGAVVTLNEVAATGYASWYFSGDVSGYAPQTVTMSAPRSVTANFYCNQQFQAYPNSSVGPDASQRLLQWTAGPNCAWSVSSDSSWLTFIGNASGTGNGSLVFSVVPNTGASRTATITFSGDLTQTITVTQNSAGPRLSVLSLSPASGSGLTQTFTLDFYDANFADLINLIVVQFDLSSNPNACEILFTQSGSWSASLGGNTVQEPGGTATNGNCTITGSPFSFVTNGTYATLTIGVTFAPAYAGTHSMSVTVSDSTFAASFPTVIGQYTVTPTPNTITFPSLADIPVTTTSVALSATASSGLAITYTSNTPNVCTISGSTANILIAGGCSITATQPGDSTYAAATPVTQKFTATFGDIAPADHFYDAINAMAQHGITAGCGSNDFCPLANVTRDQMAIFIVRAIYGNDNFTYNATPYFTDVPSGAFGFKWIQKMKDLGITAGCTATTYCPGAPVTRDQMAIFIIRARLGLALAGGSSPSFTYPTTPYFADVAPGAFGYDWIQRMKLDGITAGCSVAHYCPSAPVIRGDMAVFIMRGAFNQFLPANTPMITQVSPSSLPLGTSATFTITGVNTNFVQGVTTLGPIPGVTIGAITVSSPTTLTVQLTASSAAVAQPYSILAITGDEQALLPNGLVLQ